MPCSLAFYSTHYFSKHGDQTLEISLTSYCNHRLWRMEIIKLDYIHISYLFITSYTLIHPQRQVKVSQDFHKETFHLVSNWKCKIRSEFQQGSHTGTEALAYKWVCALQKGAQMKLLFSAIKPIPFMFVGAVGREGIFTSCEFVQTVHCSWFQFSLHEMKRLDSIILVLSFQVPWLCLMNINVLHRGWGLWKEGRYSEDTPLGLFWVFSSSVTVMEIPMSVQNGITLHPRTW